MTDGIDDLLDEAVGAAEPARSLLAEVRRLRAENDMLRTDRDAWERRALLLDREVEEPRLTLAAEQGRQEKP